jgi:multimeric flavodoxin WrbA
MRALFLNCSLKPGSETSNTQALAEVVLDALRGQDVEVTSVRAVDKAILPGVSTDMGDGDEWPELHEAMMSSEILVIGTPTWLGQPSSVSKRVLERMDAMLAEKKDDGTYAAYNKVAGVVVTGNEDGAHHVISEVAGALIDIGFTVPGQAWTYWNRGPGAGKSYLQTDEGHEWSASTGRTMANNLVAVARALQANPMPAV